MTPLASRLEPALKPNQPTHSSEAPIIVMVSECGGIGSVLIADALADHEAAHQAGDARIDVDHGAAGEVERAPAPEQAAVGRRVGQEVRARPVPDHVRDREIDERQPQHDEDASAA